MLCLDFKELGVNINAERYVDSLKCLQVSIKNKRPGKLTNGVILLQDNADVYKRQVCIYAYWEFCILQTTTLEEQDVLCEYIILPYIPFLPQNFLHTSFK